MEQVSLRDYCEAARSLIQSGEPDRAILITRHILRHHPRHVESYRVLGQALLAAGNYQEASRQFRRVLGADPEDVSSRVGLAEIHKATGDLDKAIWHMQRAIDLSPGESDLRMQLRRLSKARQRLDTSQQLEITRAALGRIYARGGLNAKAVQEFEAFLEQNPDRADVQTSLAEVLWRAGRHLEAAEASRRVLDRLPNALKANLIVGALWLENSQPDEAEPHLRLAQALDPENIVAQSFFGEQSPLSPLTVKIERLGEDEIESAQKPPPTAPVESMPVFQASEPGADWMSELHEEDGASMMSDEERADEEFEVPDWLQDVGDDLLEEEDDEAAASSHSEHDAVEDEEIPTWLGSLVARAEEPGVSGESPPTEPGDVPDWLQELRPEVPEEAAADSDMPDWLTSIAAGQPPDESEVESAPALPESDSTPTAGAEEGRALWEQISAEEEADLASAEEVPSPEADAEEAATPPPVEKTEPSVLEPVGDIVEESDVPDWLREIAVGETAQPEQIEPIATADETFPEVEVDEAGLPDWLRGFEQPEAEEKEPEIQPVSPEAAGEPAVEAEDGRALWEQILAEEGLDLTSVEEMRPTEAEGMTAEEWLRSTSDLDTTPSAPTTPEPAAEQPPEEPEVMGVESDEAVLPDWLRQVAADELAPVEEGEPVTPTPEVEALTEAEVFPDLTPEEAGEMEEALEVEVDEAGLPDWLREPSIEAAESLDHEVPPTEPEAVPPDEMPEWLTELEAGELTLAEPGFEEPIELETGEMPGWLSEVMAEEPPFSEEWTADSEMALPAEAEAQEEEMPDWLRPFREEEEEAEIEPAADMAELEAAEQPEEMAQPVLPDWLRRLREGVPDTELLTLEEQAAAEAEEPVEVEAAPPVEPSPEPELVRPEATGPEWLGELVRDEESLAELEAIEEEITPGEAVTPTSVEYIEAVEAEVSPAEPSEPEPEPVATDESPITRPLEPLQVEDLPKDPDARLAMARAALNAGDWSEALIIYETLVTSSELLDSVIDDVEIGIRRHADDAAGYQLLGDACMKDGRLQDALQAYRTALTKL